METIPFAEERNAAFAKLAERAAQANMTPAERAAYEESRKNTRDYYNAIDTAVEEERANTKRMVITKMHADGFSVSIISKYVELTEAEVLNIIQSLS